MRLLFGSNGDTSPNFCLRLAMASSVLSAMSFTFRFNCDDEMLVLSSIGIGTGAGTEFGLASMFAPISPFLLGDDFMDNSEDKSFVGDRVLPFVEGYMISTLWSVETAFVLEARS